MRSRCLENFMRKNISKNREGQRQAVAVWIWTVGDKFVAAAVESASRQSGDTYVTSRLAFMLIADDSASTPSLLIALLCLELRLVFVLL